MAGTATESRTKARTEAHTDARDEAPLAREPDRRGRAWRAALAGAAAGAAYLPVSTLLLRPAFERCGDGWSAIGCAAFMAHVVLVTALVVTGLLGAAVLRALRVRAALPIGLAGALSAGALWPVIRELSDSRVVVVLVIAATYAGAYALHSTFRVRPEGLRVVVTLVLAFYAFQALEPVGAEIDSERFDREQAAEVEREVTWQVHEPSVLPRGFSLDHTTLMDIGPRRGMYRWEFKYSDNVDNDRGVVTVTSFPMQPTFRPPADCGWPYPADAPSRPLACRQVGTLPTGEPIYQWRENNVCSITCVTYFVRIGDTLTTVKSDWAMRPAEALPMIRSLRPVPKERLVELTDN